MVRCLGVVRARRRWDLGWAPRSARCRCPSAGWHARRRLLTPLSCRVIGSESRSGWSTPPRRNRCAMTIVLSVRKPPMASEDSSMSIFECQRRHPRRNVGARHLEPRHRRLDPSRSRGHPHHDPCRARRSGKPHGRHAAGRTAHPRSSHRPQVRLAPPERITNGHNDMDVALYLRHRSPRCSCL
jgi:hypothetical protein